MGFSLRQAERYTINMYDLAKESVFATGETIVTRDGFSQKRRSIEQCLLCCYEYRYVDRKLSNFVSSNERLHVKSIFLKGKMDTFYAWTGGRPRIRFKFSDTNLFNRIRFEGHRTLLVSLLLLLFLSKYYSYGRW